LVLLLTTLRLYTRIIIPRQGFISRSFLLLVTLALGGTAAYSSTGADALSNVFTSFLALFALNFFAALVPFASLFLDQRLASRLGDGARYLLFPALWATAWAVIGVAPAGRLFAWEPAYGIDAYRWIRPILGPWAIDWVAAAWAVVLSEAVGSAAMGAAPEESFSSESERSALIDIDHDGFGSSSRRTQRDVNATSGTSQNGRVHALLTLGTILLALTVPSLEYPGLPLPVRSDDTLSMFVGCVLPGPVTGGHPPGLGEFIEESKKLTKARVLVWPEGSVRWDNDEQRKDTLELVQKKVIVNDTGRFVGIGFEQSLGTHSRYERHHKLNGFLVIGKEGVVHEYYKRTLVPITESFSMVPGVEPPTLTDIPWAQHLSRRKTEYRNATITSSICLDFASLSPFHALHERPALVLAPARTWNIGAGRAMWAQARARAEEIHAPVLWCDGGEGGVSGIASARSGEPLRVGQGSWEAEVAVEWPLRTQRTAYAWAGDWMGLVVVWLLVGAGSIAEAGVVMLHDLKSQREGPSWLGSAGERVKTIAGKVTGSVRAIMPKRRGEEQPLLHDA
jgi:hypothetical protein